MIAMLKPLSQGIMLEVDGEIMRINRIKNNLDFIFNRFTIVVSLVFALISGIQMFIDWIIWELMISKIKWLYY